MIKPSWTAVLAISWRLLGTVVVPVDEVDGIHAIDKRILDAASLAIMVGGESADVERVRPVLSSLGQRITHMGASRLRAAFRRWHHLGFTGNRGDRIASRLAPTVFCGVS